MYLQKLHDTVQSGGMSADIPLFTAQNLQDTMPALLAALDAAEASGDQVRAEQLIMKIYEIMDFIAQGPDQDPV